MESSNFPKIKLAGEKYKEKFRLFSASTEFQKIEKKVREYFFIDDDGSIVVPEGTEDIEGYAMKTYAKMQAYFERIVDHYNLPKPFTHLLFAYFGKQGVADRIENNFLPFKVVPNPLPIRTLGKDGKTKITKYARTVSLVTYGRLTTDEERLALKELKAMQDFCLPPQMLQRTRKSRKMDRDLDVHNEMATRERKRTRDELVPHNYVALKAKGAAISPKELRKLKKEHPGSFQKITTGKSSTDVASFVLGSSRKGSTARVINSRLNKKLKKLSS